jgi:glycosyltransferase involved in cell wall biosynthesis
MKIAMVSENASPLAVLGGVDAGAQNLHVADLSAALARRGHAVTVYTRRDDPDLPERVETPQGYNVVHVPAGPPEPLAEDELLRAIGPFAQNLDATWTTGGRPEIAHAHFWTSGIATELVARHLNLPTLLSFHGFGADGLRRRWESKLAKAATCVSASCTDEAFELIRMGRPRRCTSVNPCGVNVDVFTPAGLQAPRDGRPRIVGIGKLLPRNGFDAVIRALPHVPDAEFVLVGNSDEDDPQSEREARRLRGLADQVGVTDRLRLRPAATVADMPALLRSADLLACTPSYDPSGIVALEAMACGVPVVASAVAALTDIVVHEVTGYLIAPDDPRALATSVNALLRDSFLRRSLGAAGRDRAVARYAWERIAADTLRIYSKSMSSRSSEPTAASL